MNRQEVFDKVVAHAAQMTKRSAIGLHCLYYNEEDGNRCFVGIFLTENAAIRCNPLGAWTSVYAAITRDGEVYRRTDIPKWMESWKMASFLRQLQRLHDETDVRADQTFSEAVREPLKEFADEYGLVFNWPQKTTS